MKRFFIILLVIMSTFTAISASAETAVQMSYTVVLSHSICQGMYTGEIKNGLPHGYGVFAVQDTSGDAWHYLGEWSNGKMSGQGGRYWDSGKAEVGTFDKNALISTGYAVTASKNSNTKTSEVTVGQRNALRSASNYLSFMAFSYKGLIEQLEYEGYTTDEATYAANNCGADWFEQAAKSAKQYLSFMSFSRSGLIEQLEYEGFTYKQAVYGAEQNGY